MPDPLRDMRNSQRKAQDMQNAPGRELGQAKSKGRQLLNTPGREARQAKNQALNPLYNANRQAKSIGGQVRGLGVVPMPRRQYKRQAERRTTTDFAVSAMFFPVPLLAFFGGMVSDWDTSFTRHNMINARMLWVVMVILFPLSPFLWLYSWFLGFKAYSGKRTNIPVLTNFAQSKGWIESPQPAQ
ncbi:MAG: hypothetical protein HY862_08440 [Chloroflexi bacterium]|nr:hypothetical protein [Chloroflexota bacterium]